LRAFPTPKDEVNQLQCYPSRKVGSKGEITQHRRQSSLWVTTMVRYDNAPIIATLPLGMPDLDLLRTFLAVYRSGTLAAASVALGRMPAEISADLRALERHLGRRLFEARTRGMWPTPEAHTLATQVAPHLDALMGAARTAASNVEPLTGELRLAGPPELMSIRVVPTLAPLSQRGLRIRVRTGTSVEMLALLGGNEADLVVSTVRPMSKSIDHMDLFEERFLLVGAPQWAEHVPAGMAAERMAKILADLPFVVSGEDLSLVRAWWHSVFGAAFAAAPAVVMPDLRGAIEVAVAGVGIIVAPHYAVEGAMGHGDLVNLVPGAEPPTNPVELVWRRTPTLSTAMSEARRLLESTAKVW
jgi:DNA-binding transcriptional LysR family regulator